MIASHICSRLDVGQVTTKKGKKFPFFEMAAVGLAAALYPDANRAVSRELSGLKDAATTLTRQVAKPKVSRALDNNRKIEVDSMLVMISNAPVFRKRFLWTPAASLQDGLLDISVYQDFGKAELLGYYSNAMNAGRSENGRIQRYRARKLKVKGSPKMKVMADGVKLGKGTVTIKMRSGTLRVISAQKSGLPVLQKDRAESMSVPVAIGARKNHRDQIKALPEWNLAQGRES